MPTYEYRCKSCGTITEVFQSMTDKPRRKLRADDNPQCDCKAGVERLIGSGGGIIFKGSGFYETDYRSESYKKAAEADKPKSESKSDGKSGGGSSESSGSSKSESKSSKKTGDTSTPKAAGKSD